MIILSYNEANMVIHNARTKIQQGYMQGRKITKAGRISSSGLERFFNSVIDDFIAEYGIIVTGSALEEVMRTLDLADPTLYYPASEGSEIGNRQEEARDYFETQMQSLIDELIEQMQNEEEELDEEQLERYKRERKNVQSRIYRARRKGKSIPSLERLSSSPTLSDFKELENFIDRWL